MGAKRLQAADDRTSIGLKAFLPSFISCLRLPMALLFISSTTSVRVSALVVAATSDFLDGYLARRMQARSKIGAWLDALMDKLFAFAVVYVFWSENAISPVQIACFLSRDMAVFAFSLYLWIRGQFSNYTVTAFACGKISTTLQFLVIGALTMHIPVPAFVYDIFVILGVFSFIELQFKKK